MAENKKENKILYKHHLLCSNSKCGFKFSIEHEKSNNTEIGLDKMKCPLCSKPIQLDGDMLALSGKPSLEHQSKMNIAASKEALHQAAEHKKKDKETGENKQIPVTSTQKGSFGQTQRIPEKVIKSIEEKVSPELSE